MFKRLLKTILILLIIIRIVGWQIERFLNRVDRSVQLPPMDHESHQMNQRVPVIDLHNDTLMCERDFLQRSSIGHIDLPRAVEGGVDLMVFAVATEIPLGFNKDLTDHNRPDLMRIVYGMRTSPMTTMTPFERAKYQAGRLNGLVARSDGKLRQVLNQGDLEAVVSGSEIGALLGFEGAQAVGNRPENIHHLFDMGYRVAGLSHFHDNIYTGSAHGWHKNGLTTDGKKLVELCAELNMVIDVAHLSPKGIDDVLALTSGPIISSHTGVRGLVDNNRNLSNDHVKEIAARGGMIGIGFWEEAVGSNRPEAIVETIRYVIDLFGEDCVGFGSDFDGGIRPSFDVSQLSILTGIMRARGMGEETIKKVLGGNALRVLRTVLPK